MRHSLPRIDLFSDTKSRPSDAMKKAMVEAELGDEQADEDPTTIELCDHVADLLGKEKALFLPSGTMCNQIALAIHCRPGDEIIAEETAHIINFEVGGAAVLANAMIRPVKGTNGLFALDQLEAALRPAFRHAPKSRLVSVEQTSNLGGGSVWPLERLKSISGFARDHQLLVHMDGARLMNAVVASGVSAKEYGAQVDTVWIDLSKGLGCPVGGVLAGSAAFIQEAWQWKQRLGGSMRQSGIIAAAGLYALKHNVARLAEDHDNAKFLAHRLADIPGLEIDPARVETNIILLRVTSDKMSAHQVADTLAAQGIRIGAMTDRTARLVTHLDVDRRGVTEAGDAIAEVLTGS